jgi:anti-sigma factor RsiW
MDDRTEQLITRRLDGEITEQESLELDKRLIRSPEARAYMEELDRIDSLAGTTLRDLCSTSGTQSPPEIDAESSPWRTHPGISRRYLRPVMAVAAAIAVALLVILLPSERPTSTDRTPLAARDNHGTSGQTDPTAITVPVDNNWSGLPTAGKHEVLGVYDDATQSLYLLEMSPRTNANRLTAMDF